MPSPPHPQGLQECIAALHDGQHKTVLSIFERASADMAELLSKAVHEPEASVRMIAPGEEQDVGKLKSTIGIMLGDGDSICYVQGCVPGSPAYLSDKLKKGDRIVKVDNKEVGPKF